MSYPAAQDAKHARRPRRLTFVDKARSFKLSVAQVHLGISLKICTVAGVVVVSFGLGTLRARLELGLRHDCEGYKVLAFLCSTFPSSIFLFSSYHILPALPPSTHHPYKPNLAMSSTIVPQLLSTAPTARTRYRSTLDCIQILERSARRHQEIAARDYRNVELFGNAVLEQNTRCLRAIERAKEGLLERAREERVPSFGTRRSGVIVRAYACSKPADADAPAPPTTPPRAVTTPSKAGSLTLVCPPRPTRCAIKTTSLAITIPASTPTFPLRSTAIVTTTPTKAGVLALVCPPAPSKRRPNLGF
jgi:hypothetical protein